MIGIQLKEFQEKAVSWMLNHVNTYGSTDKVVVKAPTGSGKTIILVSFVEELFKKHKDRKKLVVCWFCPGKGDLETQSRDKMRKFTKLASGDLADALNSGFRPGTSYFINWETITKKDNIAIREGENANIFDRINEAHNSQYKFIVIIDEEHMNNTVKSSHIINALKARHEIRVSATPVKPGAFAFYEIPEKDVIAEGLITRYLVVNPEVEEDLKSRSYQDEVDSLLRVADKLRKEIAQAYIDAGEQIRPLVLIQFPNENEERINYVEEELARLGSGYTYQNGMVASWFSENKKKTIGKRNLGDTPETSITNHNAQPVFLLFKQAIATGWDCPRAKILVKLRENMSDTFEIQTLGRLRRMPKAHHYGNDKLDCAFLLTFDEKYKQAVLKLGNAYKTNSYTIKEEAKSISLVKEVKESQVSINERELYDNLRKFFITKYNLEYKNKQKKTVDQQKVREVLEEHGYKFTTLLERKFLRGVYEETDKVGKKADLASIYVQVNTHAHGIDFTRNVEKIGLTLGINYRLCASLLRTLFFDEYGDDKLIELKLLNLLNNQFYAFIINNYEILKELFLKFSASHQRDIEIHDNAVTTFTIPETEILKFVSEEVIGGADTFKSNVYHGYNKGNVNSITRSHAEIAFEYYCERSSEVKFVYKNGDIGEKYFSIIYQTGVKDRLFYPDYIVQLQDGSIWIIETKGGETSGHSENIDVQSKNKFDALKRYAQKYQVNFAFVRFKEDKGYYNNSEYSEEMSTEHWKELSELF